MPLRTPHARIPADPPFPPLPRIYAHARLRTRTHRRSKTRSHVDSGKRTHTQTYSTSIASTLTQSVTHITRTQPDTGLSTSFPVSHVPYENAPGVHDKSAGGGDVAAEAKEGLFIMIYFVWKLGRGMSGWHCDYKDMSSRITHQ